jgi:predicted nucleic acid-binding protein
VFHEKTEVPARPKFAAVLSKDRRNEVLEFLTAAAMWVFPAGEIQDCRDAKDNCYLDLALAAGATTIDSGDEDLLVLKPWRGIHVVRPAEFLERFWIKLNRNPSCGCSWRIQLA